MTATKQQEEVVMIDDPRAATLVTVTGWRSRDGRFYGDNEHSARWAGCTHVKMCIRDRGREVHGS